jgi:uncharacterized protein
MKRELMLEKIHLGFKNHSIVALLGSRQCGKTTLACMFGRAEEKNRPIHYFDLEDEVDLVQLASPKLLLEPLKGLIVIDEDQLQPKLFPILRVLVDQANSEKKFLILGSASRLLINQTSKSLAGRIAYIELTPFQYSETQNLRKLWLRGGFPKSYLAESNKESWI